MKYQLGKVLKFNNAEWGYIDYKKGRLTVFSLSEKRKLGFKLDKSTFDKIYSRASGTFWAICLNCSAFLAAAFFCL